jgi:hypothetical protein
MMVYVINLQGEDFKIAFDNGEWKKKKKKKYNILLMLLLKLGLVHIQELFMNVFTGEPCWKELLRIPKQMTDQY